MISRCFIALLLLLPLTPVAADAQGTPLSAQEMAAKLRSPNGTAFVRLRMEFGGGSLQLQVKERRSGANADIVYQVLFPKERKGEAVLLRKSGGRVSGSLFTPPQTVRPLTAGNLSGGLFGSDLAYEDVVDDFFAWPNQALVGTEEVGRVTCQILESKPGKGGSSYASVRSWIDTRRMVPLRVEKYAAGGRLARRIETTNVENDDLGRNLPATLTVQKGGSSTIIQGSRIKHGVAYSDADFSPEGLASLTAPRSAEN